MTVSQGESDEFNEPNANVFCCSKLGVFFRSTRGKEGERRMAHLLRGAKLRNGSARPTDGRLWKS
ncbi:hypothetical protein [Rhodococcus erythropolis]|uniref:hypothetical protein n=1 Tax=Rhodococcus erythropolis TaxID=1833 RepID=UPI00381D1B96